MHTENAVPLHLQPAADSSRRFGRRLEVLLATECPTVSTRNLQAAATTEQHSECKTAADLIGEHACCKEPRRRGAYARTELCAHCGPLRHSVVSHSYGRTHSHGGKQSTT